MRANIIDPTLPKPQLYAAIAETLDALIGDEPDAIANLANAAALLYHSLPEINWAGFYLMRKGELVLGPFQGRPACIRIALGRGVCGTAAARRAVVVVPDVERFPGHIACDAASRSEIVVPLQWDGRVVGVLDVDAPRRARFDDEDRAGLERVAGILQQRVAWPTLATASR